MPTYKFLGDAVLKQTKGIPMGVNHAPFLAELYLFSYELEFMEQFLTAGPQQNTHINLFLNYFSATCRYQDDTWFGDGTHAEKTQI